MKAFGNPVCEDGIAYFSYICMEKYKYYSDDLGLEKRGIRKRNEEYIKNLKNLPTSEQTEIRQRMVINNLPLSWELKSPY